MEFDENSIEIENLLVGEYTQHISAPLGERAVRISQIIDASKEAMSDRYLSIVSMFLQGHTLKEIGAAHGVLAERTRQVVFNYGRVMRWHRNER